MADKYWEGTTSGSTGDLNVAGNWSTAGVPTAGDHVIFDGRSTQNVTSSLDVWETTDLGSLTVQSGYTGDIASTGSAPLKMSTSSGSVYLAGTGTTYLQCAGGTDTDATINKCIINGGTVHLSSQSNDNTNVAKFTEVRVIDGTVYALGHSESAGATGHGGDSGTAITTLYVTPTSSVTVRVGDQCVNYKGTDTSMSVVIDGGTLNHHSKANDFQQMGGTVNYGSTTIDMDSDDDDITTLNISGGTFNWKPQSSGSISTNPDITTLYVMAGTFDGTDMKNTLAGGVDPSITTVWHYGGTVDLRNDYANFDIGTYYDEGGTLHTSPGQQLSLEGGA